jgi:hypothetical protein
MVITAVGTSGAEPFVPSDTIDSDSPRAASAPDPEFQRPDLVEDDYFRFRHQPANIELFTVGIVVVGPAVALHM